jgi:hypothetical protein
VGPDKAQIRHVIQNKHGIIHVLKPPHGQGGDITFGGNAYDGRINVDMGINSNELDRAYLMAVMHPGPRRALVVGLSSGAWTRVIEGMPGIESVKVIEINPGYLELIGRYPEVAPLLANPRVSIEIDDGRRWLRAHPEERFDLVFPEHDLALARLHDPTAVGRLPARSEGPSHGPAASGQQCDGQHRRLPDRPRSVQARGPLQGLRLYERQPLAKRPDAEQVLRASRIGERPAFDDALFAGDGIAARLVHDPLQSAQDYIAHSEGRDSAADHHRHEPATRIRPRPAAAVRLAAPAAATHSEPRTELIRPGGRISLGWWLSNRQRGIFSGCPNPDPASWNS